MSAKQFTVLVEVNENSTWPDGTEGLFNALGGPLDDANNGLLLGIIESKLWPVAISALSVAGTEVSK